jgi:hypothetical protein
MDSNQEFAIIYSGRLGLGTAVRLAFEITRLKIWAYSNALSSP